MEQNIPQFGDAEFLRHETVVIVLEVKVRVGDRGEEGRTGRDLEPAELREDPAGHREALARIG